MDTTKELLRLEVLREEKLRALQETQDQEYQHRSRMLELEDNTPTKRSSTAKRHWMS